MSETKRILTIQDISCLGQCSIKVALPIISAFGIETAIIPSAVLSTATGYFLGYTFRDLTEDIPNIQKHWEKEGIYFDAIYTGFIGSKKQLDYIKNIINSRLKNGGLIFVDPAMGDNGKFYGGFNQEFADKMGELCKYGDYIFPNSTEACFLLHKPWKSRFTKEEMIDMAKELSSFTKRYVILKGATNNEKELILVIYDKNNSSIDFIFNDKLDFPSNGTGDIFASVFVGATLIGKSPSSSAKFASNFIRKCIEKTIDDSNHKYGLKFEKIIPEIFKLLK